MVQLRVSIEPMEGKKWHPQPYKKSPTVSSRHISSQKTTTLFSDHRILSSHALLGFKIQLKTILKKFSRSLNFIYVGSIITNILTLSFTEVVNNYKITLLEKIKKYFEHLQLYFLLHPLQQYLFYYININGFSVRQTKKNNNLQLLTWISQWNS